MDSHGCHLAFDGHSEALGRLAVSKIPELDFTRSARIQTIDEGVIVSLEIESQGETGTS